MDIERTGTDEEGTIIYMRIRVGLHSFELRDVEGRLEIFAKGAQRRLSIIPASLHRIYVESQPL